PTRRRRGVRSAPRSLTSDAVPGKHYGTPEGAPVNQQVALMSLKFGSRSDSMRDMRGDEQVWTRFNGNASHRVRLQLLNAGDTQQFADFALEWPTVALKQRHRAAEAAITDPRW